MRAIPQLGYAASRSCQPCKYVVEHGLAEIGADTRQYVKRRVRVAAEGGNTFAHRNPWMIRAVPHSDRAGEGRRVGLRALGEQGELGRQSRSRLLERIERHGVEIGEK